MTGMYGRWRCRGGWSARRTVLAALVASCATDRAGPVAPVASVEVTPATAPVPVGLTLQLTATPKDPAGAPLSGRSVDWATGASAVATVSNSGLVTAMSPGAATITATSEGKSGTATVTVVPGPAVRLEFSSQPNAATAGAAIIPALQVAARDVQGNTATGFAGNVTAALGSNPGGATLSGTTSVAAVAGVATFSDLSINKSGPGYTLQASAGSLTVATSTAITVNAGVAAQLVFTVPPGNATAGMAITPAVQVAARDAFGNTAGDFAGSVTVAIGTNPSGGVLTGTTTQPAADGVASFGDLRIDKSGAGYTLTASAAGPSSGTSSSFNITAGSVSASRAELSAFPTAIPASNGSSVATITVRARDALGNPVQGATVSLAAAGAGNTLTQPAGTTDVHGETTGTLSSTIAGTKTVSATINGVGVTQTVAVTVNAAGVSDSQSLIAAAPTTITASNGSSVATITVTARDAFGNPIQGAVVVLAATGAGNVLTQPSGATDASGVATGTLSSASAGVKAVSVALNGVAVLQGATVRVMAGGVSGMQSTMSASPSTIAASSGSDAATITVTARDAFGNPIQGAAVALSSTGLGNSLTQPGVTTDTSGVASGTLSSTVAEAKAVSATIDGVVVTQTDTVTVSASSGVSLAFTVQPTNTAAGAAITPAVQVVVRDQFGNTATGFTAPVTVAIGTNPNGGTLSGTATRAAVAGIATFGGLVIDKSGTGYTLQAASGALPLSSSAPFNITAGAVSASQSSIGASPTTIAASNGASVSTITVTVRDAGGNPIQGATVVLLATGPGIAITQPSTTTNAAGAATGTLSSTVVGTKTVTATADGVGLAQQATVTVIAGSVSALQSTVSASPATIEASNGALASTITVTARDALGNPILGATVILAATGSGNTLGQPAGTTNASGLASGTFSSTVTGAKVISATVNGTSIVQTAGVTVDPGEVSAAQSTVSASPSTIMASNGAIVSTITITARDDHGNPIPGVPAFLSASGAGNTLTQPAGVTNASGVATGTVWSTVAGAKVISATIDATGLVQTTVTVNAATADRLAFSVQPTSTTIGSAIAPAVRVEITDAFGNRVLSAVNNVWLVIGANPGGATLTGGGPTAAVDGVATFASLSLDMVGAGYTLTASATDMAGATSGAFNITAGSVSASQSTVAAVPSTITAGAGTSTITVTTRDAVGNPVSGATVVLSATGSGNTITQPVGPTDANGVATGSLSSTVVGAKTVTAIANGVTLTQKPMLTVTAGPISATQSTVSATPASIEAGSGISTITVTVNDGYGNPVSGATVLLAATGTGNTLAQPSAPTNASGVATGTLGSLDAGMKTVSATADGAPLTPTPTVMVTAPGSSVVLVGAGDIAVCGKLNDEATAALIDGIAGDVFTLGDNAYPNGTTAEFNNCYDPSWGAFKARTHPSAGNHEYDTPGAAPYFVYFGSAAGPSGPPGQEGYYSYDVGAWHVIVLNSNISTSAGSAQVQWLQTDLAANQSFCTLAYWHHPLYSSIGGPSGTTGATISSIRPLWDVLYAAGADLVLVGHRHVYERLARMRPDGTPDAVTGIRQIIAGTGGGSGGDLTNVFPTSEVREGRTYGVLKLTLSATSYTWEFVPIAGQTFTDSGTEACH